MLVYVICCNDSLECAVLEDEERAKQKLVELKEAYYAQNNWNFRSREEFNNIHYWHIHTIEAV